MKPLLSIACRTEDRTEELGRRLGALVRPGDLLCLLAPLGTGKTVLARGLVRALAGHPVEVPSPTFTLVQAYEGRVPLMHADLYRIEDPSEVLELGIDDALESGAALVEWPEHGEGYLPPHGLSIAGEGISHDGRVWHLSGDEDWARRLDGIDWTTQ
ncbi:tRNA (adenosine(37)-N6)-threonylcarbamoyltransferase complex ATPase subunit type 1 TsaE [Parvularcula sp. LCG005]|uniref:tRNA (adenosine(37)-N6)-threonylcarbamoyltransferase complex ATPase subunit type 1 TsaE n=1 Tax=Parvularcula sp. LCG005 TaxID=3078805 RepID=UPI002943DD19|nr:tRNA (adenosine(37)-N6)-threonylcarbamoyltransferase complex ATPase subunit type 1 TsaE [Parvularcula sp. LCG005]WOI53496.1 tRNA (adenosine(37)-N6)-threonylcarbamoyltransferase complex ATPase subunit type 1 TsaE [Parvularcula sp. LCG005]